MPHDYMDPPPPTFTWSTIYLGNLADMDWDESTASIEDSSPLLTTFGGDGDAALATNIVNVETQTGDHDNTVTTDNFGDFNDTLTYDLGDGSVTTQMDSVMLVNATITFYDQTTLTKDVAVMQDTSGNTFLMVLDGDFELVSQGIDSITFNSVTSSNYSGVYEHSADDLDFVCFTAGTLIETPDGPVRVDKLRHGDLVTTLDNGPQPLVWIGKQRVKFHIRPHAAQPYVIPKGAMGPNLPERDTMFSPNHRILVNTSPARALHDPLGALAPIKALTSGTSIRGLAGRREITYFSLLLPRHEVIIANGIAAESLYPGPEAFAALDADARADWLRLAARDGRLTGQAPARLMLSLSEAKAAMEEGSLTLPELAPSPMTGSWRDQFPPPAHLNHRMAG